MYQNIKYAIRDQVQIDLRVCVWTYFFNRGLWFQNFKWEYFLILQNMRKNKSKVQQNC